MKKPYNPYQALAFSLILFLVGAVFCYLAINAGFYYLSELIGTIVITAVVFGVAIFMLVIFIVSKKVMKLWEQENMPSDISTEEETDE